jgi:L-ribulose-5-phosphate 4-epimerase
MYRDAGGLRQMLVRATEALFGAGVMQFSGHGNLSARLDGDRMLLTTKGVIRGLTVDDFAVVSLDGELLEGAMDPASREIIGMHTGVYRSREDARSVIHTHSPYATTFALAHEPLPCAYEALLRHGCAGDIPIAAWAPRGSEASVSNIVAQIEQHPDVPAVLLANHGLLAFGRDPIQAAGFVVAMEEAALLTLQARALGGAKPFPSGALDREREHMRAHGSL